MMSSICFLVFWSSERLVNLRWCLWWASWIESTGMTASEESVSLKGQEPATLQVIENVRLTIFSFDYIFMDLVSTCIFTNIYCNFNCEAKWMIESINCCCSIFYKSWTFEHFQFYHQITAQPTGENPNNSSTDRRKSIPPSSSWIFKLDDVISHK